LVVALILIAPLLALAAIIGTSQPFPDDNLANVNAIDFDMSKRRHCPQARKRLSGNNYREVMLTGAVAFDEALRSHGRS
jgi:hypothetical protein